MQPAGEDESPMSSEGLGRSLAARQPGHDGGAGALPVFGRLEPEGFDDAVAREMLQNPRQCGGCDAVAACAEKIADRAARNQMRLCAMRAGGHPSIEMKRDGVSDLLADLAAMSLRAEMAARPLAAAERKAARAEWRLVAFGQADIVQDGGGEEQGGIVVEALMGRDQ